MCCRDAVCRRAKVLTHMSCLSNIHVYCIIAQDLPLLVYSIAGMQYVGALFYMCRVRDRVRVRVRVRLTLTLTLTPPTHMMCVYDVCRREGAHSHVVSFQYPRVLHYSSRLATFSIQHCRDAKCIVVTRVTFQIMRPSSLASLRMHDVQFPL